MVQRRFVNCFFVNSGKILQKIQRLSQTQGVPLTIAADFRALSGFQNLLPNQLEKIAGLQNGSLLETTAVQNGVVIRFHLAAAGTVTLQQVGTMGAHIVTAHRQPNPHRGESQLTDEGGHVSGKCFIVAVALEIGHAHSVMGTEAKFTA